MIGTRLGAARIERELGTGGMGRVYAATLEEPALGLPAGARVAVKVLHAHLGETPGYAERFRRECALGCAVRDDHVVRTYGSLRCEVDGRATDALVMELVEGQTLRALLGELGRAPEELVRHVGQNVARALEAVHAVGAVHRDVKPENVVFARGAEGAADVVKLMDLGVARSLGDSQRISRTGVFVGSLAYAAPECFDEHAPELDGRADLHALGVLLYELASGVQPFDGDDLARVVRRVLHEEPRRLGAVAPEITPFLEEVVHTLLAKRREERFASARELAQVLEAGESGAWWQARERLLRARARGPLRRPRVARETAVHGRDAELALLRRAFDAAAAGALRVVIVEGEAGIGKTRLVDELVARLEADGSAFSFLHGAWTPGGTASAAEPLLRALREHFGADGVGDALAATPNLVPAFDALLRGDAAPPGAPTLGRGALPGCIAQALRHVAATRPVLLLLDDAHGAPDDADAFVATVLRQLADAPVLAVALSRRVGEAEPLARTAQLPGASRCALERLGARQLTNLLVEAFASRHLAEELGFRIAQKSDGNPFFALEIIRGLREERLIERRRDGTWVSTRVIDEIAIPSSVVDLVNSRVAELETAERELLDVAACCGDAFDPLLVGEALGLQRVPLLRTFARIERRHRLVRAVGVRYAFDHRQIQEALYGTLPELLRRELHAALAHALAQRAGARAVEGEAAVELCEHALRGGDGALAVRTFDAAWTRLESEYRSARSADLAERLLAEPGALAGRERARVLVLLAGGQGPLDRLARYARQEEAAAEAVELAAACGDRELECRAARALGVAAYRTGRTALSERWYRRALELALETGDRESEGSAHGGLGALLFRQGALSAAGTHFERHASVARESGDRRGELHALLNLGVLLRGRGELPRAGEHFETALVLARETGDRHSESVATGNLGELAWQTGRMADARALFERDLALCREIGRRHGEIAADLRLGLVSEAEGRTNEAWAHYERALAIAVEEGDRALEAGAHVDLGNVLLGRGRPEEARTHYRSALGLARDASHLEAETAALHNLGRAHEELGERAEAVAYFDACMRSCEERGDVHRAALTHVALGRIAQEEGRLDDAREVYERARNAAQGLGIDGLRAVALAHAATLPGGDVEAAEAAFAASRDRLDASERRDLHYLLWRAGGDPAHLAAAHELVRAALEEAPPEHRTSMRNRVRIVRDVLRAVRDGAGETVAQPPKGSSNA